MHISKVIAGVSIIIFASLPIVDILVSWITYQPDRYKGCEVLLGATCPPVVDADYVLNKSVIPLAIMSVGAVLLVFGLKSVSLISLSKTS